MTEPISNLITHLCAWCHCFPCVCPRTAPCACGGHLVVLADVAVAMRDHQQTDLHQRWRARHGL